MVFSSDLGWSFGDKDTSDAPSCVRGAISSHEAIEYRALTRDGARHEFSAMIRRVLMQLGVPAAPIRPDTSPIKPLPQSQVEPEAEAERRRIKVQMRYLVAKMEQLSAISGSIHGLSGEAT